MRDAVLSKVVALQRLSLAELRQQYQQCFPDEQIVPSNKPRVVKQLSRPKRKARRTARR